MTKRLLHEHTAHAIAERLSDTPKHNYLPDFIYGGIDGAITTLAIVAGATGAEFSLKVIIILGISNLFADGFSMAASNYVSTRAEMDKLEFYRQFERQQIEKNPEGEREEIRQIFFLKGFRGKDLEHVVSVITADEEQWIQTMLHEEYNLPHSIRSPKLAAAATFTAFLICGAVPLIPYLLSIPDPFLLVCACTGATFFGIGSIKSRWSLSSWLRSGLGTLLIGSVAASIAFGLGHFIERLAG